MMCYDLHNTSFYTQHSEHAPTPNRIGYLHFPQQK